MVVVVVVTAEWLSGGLRGQGGVGWGGGMLGNLISLSWRGERVQLRGHALSYLKGRLCSSALCHAPANMVFVQENGIG